MGSLDKAKHEDFLAAIRSNNLSKEYGETLDLNGEYCYEGRVHHHIEELATSGRGIVRIAARREKLSSAIANFFIEFPEVSLEMSFGTTEAECAREGEIVVQVRLVVGFY